MKFIVLGLVGMVCLGEQVPGRLLVRAKAGADPAAVAGLFSRHGARVHRQLRQTGVSVLEAEKTSPEALTQSGLFDIVEPDYIAHTAATPDDAMYSLQWHLPAIQAPDAWDLTTGAAGDVIAVIDSGVDATHPDLADRMVKGWSFLSDNTNTSDTLGHGTAVAGVLAAAANNQTGIAGVTWQNRIMPLVVVNANDSASYSDIAAAIQYAADHGARVINISAGGSARSQTLESAVDYAWKKGALVIAAAMNASASTPAYPAGCNRAIAVSAVDAGGALAAFSNFGPWIMFSAPGSNILTTERGGGYGYRYGTSFASPIVAGVAALVLAADPTLQPADVVRILRETADDLGAPGYDASFGWGRVNALRAVQAAIGLPSVLRNGGHPPRPGRPVRGLSEAAPQMLPDE